MASIIDYGSTFLTVDGPLLNSGAGSEITKTSVYLDPANPATYHSRVELKASFGVYHEGIPNNIQVRIYRFGTLIYNSPIAVIGLQDERQIINVLAVDGGLPGTQVYTLAIQNLTSSFLSVRGPITFTATAIGL